MSGDSKGEESSRLKASVPITSEKSSSDIIYQTNPLFRPKTEPIEVRFGRFLEGHLSLKAEEILRDLQILASKDSRGAKDLALKTAEKCLEQADLSPATKRKLEGLVDVLNNEDLSASPTFTMSRNPRFTAIQHSDKRCLLFLNGGLPVKAKDILPDIQRLASQDLIHFNDVALLAAEKGLKQKNLEPPIREKLESLVSDLQVKLGLTARASVGEDTTPPPDHSEAKKNSSVVRLSRFVAGHLSLKAEETLPDIEKVASKDLIPFKNLALKAAEKFLEQDLQGSTRGKLEGLISDLRRELGYLSSVSVGAGAASGSIASSDPSSSAVSTQVNPRTSSPFRDATFVIENPLHVAKKAREAGSNPGPEMK